jgi:anti-anti-sigma regulatory factor
MATTLSYTCAFSPGSEGAKPLLRIEATTGETPGEVVVRVAGKGCVGQAAALAAGLLCLSARRPAMVTLDLSELQCISALAMGMLETFRRGVVRNGGRVRLAANLQQPVRESLEGASLFPLFDLPDR